MSDLEVIDIGTPVGDGTITTTTAGGIAAGDLMANDVIANCVYVSVATQPVRFRIDGTAATALIGHLIPAGESRIIYGEDALRNLSVIDTGAGAAAVSYTTGRRNA